MQERKRMYKTIKIIAIVLLVLGVVSALSGVASAVIGRQLMGHGIPALAQPNLPHFRGGDRLMMDGYRGGRGFNFLGLPFWLIGGGLTLLIAGAVLLIFNRKITAAVEPVENPKEKAAAKPAAVIKTKAPVAAKKSTRKKPS
jgi:hypothetical protein